MILPRVGKVISERIIELRQRLGRFDSVEQLLQVRGIGKKTLELLRPNVTVGDAPSNAARPDSAAHK
jgi:competence protein ComEA